MNNSLSTESLSSIQTASSTITNSSLLLSPSKSELSIQELSSLAPGGPSESNLVLMPGESPSHPLSEAKPSELRSRVSLSALQNQLQQLQLKQEKQVEQEQEESLQKQPTQESLQKQQPQTQPLRQLQSRVLNVSSDDVRLLGQALKEYRDLASYWGGTSV
jgi:cell division protein FtsN